MSSLKAIMDDVDVEPLSSQNYKHSIQASSHPVAPSSDSSSQASHDARGKAPVKRRKSNRVQSTTAGPDTASRYSSITEEGMDFPSLYQAGSSNRPSTSGVPESSAGSDHGSEMPVKYTPVTGRISRAKKGVPVHTCDICRPVKIFTRAEHLRRHQLSHQKPAYPCTFEDCERAFHRPDLLARHLHRHETQGEKAYKVGDPRSRASSSTSESRTPSLKVEGSTQGFPSNTEQMAPDVTITPKTSGTAESSMTASTFSKSVKDFPANNVPSSSVSSPGPGSFRAHNDFHGMSSQHGYGPVQSAFDESYVERSPAQFIADGTTPQLPLLRIPEEVWVPGLSYNSSPWCSSASDTQSDASRNGSQWVFRGRSASVATLSDSWMPHANQQDIHLLMQSVGTPAVSAYDSSLAQNSPAQPARTLNNRFDYTRTKQDSLESLLPRSPEIDSYFVSYWQFFHPILPIIHKPTFDPNKNQLLNSAMAAIGTQYHYSPEARRKGSELNEFCKAEFEKMFLDCNDLGTLQGILLTEIFTRFRGRKINVQPSRCFTSLYRKVLEYSNDLSEGPEASIVDAQFDQNSRLTGTRISPNRVQLEWHRWIEREALQRLLSACFIFDIHQSVSFQQPLSTFGDAAKRRLRFPCSTESWEACSAPQWKTQSSTAATQPLHANVSWERLGASLFTQSLLICYSLPIRDNTADPNSFAPQNLNIALGRSTSEFPDSLLTDSYLALYYTPLHDLLAVAGDTWVFSRKVTPPSAFRDSQSRLKLWSSSLAAAQATYHACRILSTILPTPLTSTHRGGVGNSDFCLSEFWSIYVSALIIWAFGHRVAKRDHPSENGTLGHRLGVSSEDASAKGLEYTKAMLSLEAKDFLTSKATVKSNTACVIEAVFQRLENENVSKKSGLLVDAIVVLGKIKEAGKGKWF